MFRISRLPAALSLFRIPFDFFRAGTLVFISCQDKEKIGQPVQINDGFFGYRIVEFQFHSIPFGPAAYGTCKVQAGSGRRTAGQDKGRQHGQFFLQFVDPFFQKRDFMQANPCNFFFF